MRSKWFVFIILFSFQIQEKGCEKKEDIPQERDYSVYDNYILDMPMDRASYKKANIKERKMMLLDMIDLPSDAERLVRIDSMDYDGKLLKSRFINDDFMDSLVYEYTPLYQIEKEHVYSLGKDTTTTQYYYGPQGMMNTVIHYRDNVTAYEMSHNKYYKLSDKRLSEESPTPSNIREIYKFDSFGRMKEAMTLEKNIPIKREKRYYDGNHRISKVEFYHQGIMMYSSEYIYNDQGLLSIRKDRTRLSKNEYSNKAFEFIYTYYPQI